MTETPRRPISSISSAGCQEPGLGRNRDAPVRRVTKIWSTATSNVRADSWMTTSSLVSS